MIAILVGGAAAILLAVASAPILIRWLKARGIGQQIREDGPRGHTTKAGTPTMGGVGIVVATVVGFMVGHLVIGVKYTRSGDDDSAAGAKDGPGVRGPGAGHKGGPAISNPYNDLSVDMNLDPQTAGKLRLLSDAKARAVESARAGKAGVVENARRRNRFRERVSSS